MTLSESTIESFRRSIQNDRTTLLSDIVNISQTPAPTFDESERADLMERRFRELNVDNVYQDPEGNVVAQIKNNDGPAICLAAHLDTVFDRSVDHTVKINDKEIRGPGVGDDSLGLATLLSMIRLLPEDEIDHLVLVATTGTEGDGNLRGARYFVDNTRLDIDFSYCLEGHRLGRIDHWSLGNNRIRISVDSQGGHVWRDREKTGENPIEVICHIVNKLRNIDQNYSTNGDQSLLNVGMIRGGSAYNTVPYECDLNVEIRSTNSSMLQDMFSQIFQTVENASEEFNVDINVQEVTRRPVSGIDKDHWLVSTMDSIHKRLGINSQKGPASSDSCVFLNAGIPTLTLGLSRGKNKHRTNEMLEVQSLEKGQLQVLMGILESEHYIAQESTPETAGA